MTSRTALMAGCAAAAAVFTLGACSSDTSGTPTAGSTTTVVTADPTSAPTSSARTTTPASRRTSEEDTAPTPTIADYLVDNGITETPVLLNPGDTPIADFQLPEGWEVRQSEDFPAYITAYGDIHQSDNFIPGAALLVSQLDGPVDAEELLEYADGEFLNLPEFEEIRSEATDLDGFPAYLLIGVYEDADFGPMVVSQRTAVIEREGVVYAIQLNVRALESQAEAIDDDASLINESLTVNR